ncbi:MAG: type II toxin-antitoxin system VapC family toxin [bacterium]
MNLNHIFIDTNVLIGSFVDKANDVDCVKYLSSLNGKKLYISSLSVAQLVSVFQKRKSNSEIKQIINSIINKFIIVSFTDSEIQQILKLDNSDMEDAIQYVISRKVKCGYFVTNNVKDYRSFNDIIVLSPKKHRAILR